MTDDDSEIRYQEASCLRFFYVHSGRFSYYNILYLPAFVFDSDYESFIYKSSSFKVSLPQCAQDSIAWESYVIMYINDINLSTSTFHCPGYPI